MEKEFNVYDLIDKKIRIEKERYEEYCMTIIVFRHVCWWEAKYDPYLIYKKFNDLPAKAIITNKNIDDINIINNWNPFFPNTPWYTEVAELITWNYEMAQITSGFEKSKCGWLDEPAEEILTDNQK